jgi:hypothetical protein
MTETVNGNDVNIGTATVEETKNMKELARELPRNDSRIDKINSSSVCYAVVWIDDNDTRFNPPEGYYIESVYLSLGDKVGIDIGKCDE